MATKNNPCRDRRGSSWSRRRIGVVAALLAAIALTSPLAAAAQATDYAVGKAHWQGRRYPPAEASLLKHRKLPYGSTVEVDFMLGTGGCRIKAERVWGGNVLQHALQRYQMTKVSRETITRELKLCRKAVRAIEPGGAADSVAADRAAVESVIGPLAAAQGEFDLWFRKTHRVIGTPPE